LYEYTPRQFYNYLQGFRFRESEQYKFQMEQNRYVVWSNLLPHLAKKDQKSLQDSWPFPWDIQAVSKSSLTPDQKKEHAARLWEKIDRKKEQ
jgi:hypothetical protein